MEGCETEWDVVDYPVLPLRIEQVLPLSYRNSLLLCHDYQNNDTSLLGVDGANAEKLRDLVSEV